MNNTTNTTANNVSTNEIKRFGQEQVIGTQTQPKAIGIINKIFAFIGTMLVSFVKGTYNVVKEIVLAINRGLIATGYKYHILAFVALCVVATYFKAEINSTIDNARYQVAVWQQDWKLSHTVYAEEQEAKEVKEQTKEEISSTLKTNLVYMLKKATQEYQNVCITKNTAKYVKSESKNGTILIDESIISLKQEQLVESICTLEKAYKQVTEDMGIHIKMEDIYKNDEPKKEVKKEVKKQPIKKTTTKELTGSATSTPAISMSESLVKKTISNLSKKSFPQLKKVPKPQGKLKDVKMKAVFCVYGHGMGKKWADPGSLRHFNKENDAFMKNIALSFKNGPEVLNRWFVSERDLIVENTEYVCQAIENYINKNKLNIKLYRLGQNAKQSLRTKIKEMYRISKENGYTTENSISIAVHVNKANVNNMKGEQSISQSIVFFSHVLNKRNNGKNEQLANTILKNIVTRRKIKNDRSVVKSDRGHWLGIVSGDDTPKKRPMGILVEMGFITNDTDLKQMIQTDIYKKGISEGVIEYIKNFK